MITSNNAKSLDQLRTQQELTSQKEELATLTANYPNSTKMINWAKSRVEILEYQLEKLSR